MSHSLVTEEFLDTYEGEVLFLSQDLENIIKEVSAGDVTQEGFEILEQKLNDVGDVFLSSTYTQHVSPVFKEFADYVGNIKCDDLMQFNDVIAYLSAIISDINTYINFYFVKRFFSDVYIFQDSLINSIKFFQRAYSCKLGDCDDDDGSRLDFL